MIPRLALAALLPFAALGLQWLLWPWIQPFVWFVFLPTLFVCAHLAGKWGGLIGTGLSAVLAWYFFIPPQLSWDMATTSNIGSLVLFLIVGVLVSRYQARLEQVGEEKRRAEERSHRADQRIVAIDAERRRSGEALRESERRFEATFEQAAVGIALVTPDDRWLRVNRKLCEILGYRPEDLRSRSFLDIAHPDVQEAAEECMRRLLRGASACCAKEGRCIGKDGRAVWIKLCISLACKDTGKPDHFIAVIEDIQARKEAEAALRKFSRVIEQTASTVVITDPGGVIEYVNPRFTETSGYAPAEAIGRCPSLLKSGQTAAEEYRRMWQTIRAGGVWHGEFHNRRKDGSLYWESAIISPIRDDDGRITHFAGIKDDITARKEAEAALQDLRTELEQLLTLHVASQTAAAIAHELNQPLSALSTYTEAAACMLRAGNPQPDRLLQVLERSALQAQRAATVMRELTAFLHKGEAPTESFDLNASVRRALAIVESNGYGGFSAVVDLAPDLRQVQANRVQVDKVLVVLVQNGVEAMRAAGVATPAIIISVRTAADADQAQVTVRDTGPGLDETTARRVFEPFFSTKPKGLGMGLAISRSLIEAHGGKLWVDPDEGGGATFHFTLPYAP